MALPSITPGQIAIDPVNGIMYYKNNSNVLINTTLNWAQENSQTIGTEDSVEIDGSIIISGNLTVNGTTVTVNTETVLVEDNILILNVNAANSNVANQLNSGIEVERGTLQNVGIIWNEALDKWQFTNDGINYVSLNENVSTANAWTAPITINLSGDLSGNVSIDGSSNVTLTASLVSNAVVINELADVVITSASNGELLQYNGSAWVNSTMPGSEPIGHENKSQSVLSFDETTREFSISPASTSYTVWCKGKRFVKTSTETIEIPNISGLYYIYFSNNGVLSYKTTFFDWENDTPTAYIYWNQNDAKAYFFADERHGVTLDWATHEYLHRTRGAVIASGFGANGYTITGDGSSDTHAVISIANGTFFDEDLQVDITHSATPTANTWEQRLQANAYIPIFYHSNTHWKKDTASQFPMKQGTQRVQYNVNTAGNWSTSDIDNNKWGITWVVATNNLNEPVLGILGQDVYLTIGEAQASVWEDLNLDGFPILEFRPLYKIIYQTANAYSNTPHAKIQGVLDLRRVVSSDQGIPTTPVSDHGSMTGLLDDDHVQYFNDTRHDAHDHSTALASASINDLSDVNVDTVQSGDFLRYNGTIWVNGPINLSTDTSGNYVQNLVAGTGITITNNSGEGSTPTIAVTTNAYDSYGAAATAEINAASALSNHVLDTTYIHGIADTSLLVTTTGTQTLTNKTITSPSGLVKGDVGLGNVDNTSDANKPVSTATQTELNLKAPLSSPSLTGIPTAPTAAPLTNNTQIATTAYTDAAVAAIVDTAPALLNTLNELAAAIGDDENFSTTITNSIALKAPIDSPTFTGTVTFPNNTVFVGNLTGQVSDISNHSYIDEITSGNNIIITPGVGLGPFSVEVATSATPNFNSVSTTSLYVDGIEIDTTGAQNGYVLKYNGTKFVPNVDLAEEGVGILAKFTAAIGDGINSSYIVTHNFNTRNVIVEVYDNSTYETVLVKVLRSSVNAVTVSFAAPIDTNSYTVVVVG